MQESMQEGTIVTEATEPTDIAALTAVIVSAYVSSNKVAASEVADLIAVVAGGLKKVGAEPERPAKQKAIM